MFAHGYCYYCNQPCTVNWWNGSVFWIADPPTIEEEPI